MRSRGSLGSCSVSASGFAVWWPRLPRQVGQSARVRSRALLAIADATTYGCAVSSTVLVDQRRSSAPRTVITSTARPQGSLNEYELDLLRLLTPAPLSAPMDKPVAVTRRILRRSAFVSLAIAMKDSGSTRATAISLSRQDRGTRKRSPGILGSTSKPRLPRKQSMSTRFGRRPISYAPLTGLSETPFTRRIASGKTAARWDCVKSPA